MPLVTSPGPRKGRRLRTTGSDYVVSSPDATPQWRSASPLVVLMTRSQSSLPPPSVFAPEATELPFDKASLRGNSSGHSSLTSRDGQPLESLSNSEQIGQSSSPRQDKSRSRRVVTNRSPGSLQKKLEIDRSRSLASRNGEASVSLHSTYLSQDDQPPDQLSHIEHQEQSLKGRRDAPRYRRGASSSPVSLRQLLQKTDGARFPWLTETMFDTTRDASLARSSAHSVRVASRMMLSRDKIDDSGGSTELSSPTERHRQRLLCGGRVVSTPELLADRKRMINRGEEATESVEPLSPNFMRGQRRVTGRGVGTSKLNADTLWSDLADLQPPLFGPDQQKNQAWLRRRQRLQGEALSEEAPEPMETAQQRREALVAEQRRRSLSSGREPVRGVRQNFERLTRRTMPISTESMERVLSIVSP